MSCGLIQQDFIPECTERGSFASNPSFERLNVVVVKANFFLAQNAGVIIKSCETIRHRVETNGQLKKPSNLNFTQYGSEIKGCYVDGLRLWLATSDSNGHKKPTGDSTIQLDYFHVLPQCGKESVVQDTMDSLTKKLSGHMKNHRLQGHLLAVEAIDVRGVKQCELLDPEAATLTAAENPYGNSVMTFLRVWYQRQQRSSAERFSVGLVTFVPELNLDTHETFIGGSEYKHLNRGNVERYSKVMEYVNSWREIMPQNARILNMKTYSARIEKDGSYDCHSTYKKVFREPKYGHRHLRFIRVFFVTPISEEDAPPPYPSALPPITCKVFKPDAAERGFLSTKSPFESKEILLERLDRWITLTEANVISVETIAYKAFTGEESRFGEETMCTKDDYHHEKNRGYVPDAEKYVIVYRVFVEGVYHDPPGFEKASSQHGTRHLRDEKQPDRLLGQ